MIETVLTDKTSRRVFVRNLGAIPLSLISLTLLGGCESLFKAIANRPTRRRLRTGSPEVAADIATYRQAVQLMKSLPPDNPRSWAAQAAMHGSVAAGFNLCQHGTAHFLSWHRAYLVFFEQICRQLTGNAHFALPYWNWNQNPDLLPDFTDTASPLFHPRTRTSLSGFAPVSTTTLDPILIDANFFSFGATLESPHDNVHIRIGQNMASGGSALDPVFWMHHCMIDYCWAKWNIELGNDNTNDSAWVNTSWNHFFDKDGNPATITAGQTTVLPLLFYQYESSAIGSNPAAAAIQTSAEVRRRIEAGAEIKLDVSRRILIVEALELPISRPYSSRPALQASEIAAIASRRESESNIFLSAEFAKFPVANDFFVRVFLNLPEASASTPTTDAHYAGSIAFFGSPGAPHSEHHAISHLVNITPTLRTLTSRGELRDNSSITVQLVTVPANDQFQRPDVTLSLRRIELLVSPLVVRKR